MRLGHGPDRSAAPPGGAAARLAVLAGNPKGLAFWTGLGYQVVDHREDVQMQRPCAVLRKDLGTP
ncbi:hypothetical protein ABZ499_13840 [Streptomyces sp. NPDC019990]|uniref:hypothetical protein n=1 Tax=Streptomyces sp. NPDC019990 TaxID=3154693 RepID=UPI0033F9B2D3